MMFGAELQEGGGTTFRLWAPSAAHVVVELELAGGSDRHAMQKNAAGWHEAFVADAAAGARYRYALGNGLRVADPASRSNPDGVHGPSAVVDATSHVWHDQAWCGRPWHEAVFYELHIGTFTAEGTYAAAAARLPELAELGITAVEIMPVAEFAGRRNWGYDGVLPFAPAAAYGTPDALKALVDVAHGLGLMVVLDVVYNHFGPEGNYLHAYCPEFFNPRHQTPWGAAVNFDGDSNGPVRQFFAQNALYWIEEFHFDGLRLDAVHQIRDDSPTHIVCEIAALLRQGPGRGREVHLILENDANRASWLQRAADGTPLCATAQWNDDLHHAAHVVLTGETDGYYVDYAEAPVGAFARALAEGFVYQGQYSAHQDAPRGEPSERLPASAFVSFLQNHDQIGNRALGERIDTLAGDPHKLEAAQACLLLSPHVPMLFMGEEFAASSPFLYFCDFEGDLGQAVSAGRRAEFARFAAFADERTRQSIPDPNAERTFEMSKLRWEERHTSPHRERLAFIAELLRLRARHLMPRLPGPTHAGRWHNDGSTLRVAWTLGDGSSWHLWAHFGPTATSAGAVPAGATVFSRRVQRVTDGTVRLDPGAVLVVSGAGA